MQRKTYTSLWNRRKIKLCRTRQHLCLQVYTTHAVLLLFKKFAKENKKFSLCRDLDISWYTLPCPLRSRSIRPFSVPMRRLTPHRAAHKISELNLFLYFRISGVSVVRSWEVGVTLTLGTVEPPTPAPPLRGTERKVMRLGLGSPGSKFVQTSPLWPIKSTTWVQRKLPQNILSFFW